MRYLLLIVAYSLLTICRAQVKPCDSGSIHLPTQPRMAVNDFAAMLDSTEKVLLEQKLRTYYAKTSNEVYVITIDSLAGCNINEKATQYWKVWKFGSKEKNNGVLFLISKFDRNVRIQVGLGLEDVLPDERCKAILEKSFIPGMRKGNLFLALNESINELMLYIGDKFKNEESSYIHNE